ncbi:hypothetical protein K435DRAFT_800417 [Dendrothele bispora CBS 962.96]|uniref:Uncharacterized protein n=1 Tax=Dendrothele bispora (strain CBS 962.96) TaxID=1314807 RepID=A0A4S8LTY1_DENBC|nr:hypothetical protein K435DRAFT_800417 [Dendrothele bispora CBS 962.96]
MSEQVPPPEPNQEAGTNTATTQNTPGFVLDPLKPLGQRVFFFQLNRTHAIRPEQWVIPTICLGMTGLDNVPHLTRSQYKTRVLKDYFSMLDRFLTNFKVTETKPGDSKNNRTVYSFSASNFQELASEMEELLNVHEVARALRLKGRRVPEISYWPEGSVGTDYFLPNNIEIIALAYRVSIEQFLLQIDEVYDFEKGDV